MPPLPSPVNAGTARRVYCGDTVEKGAFLCNNCFTCEKHCRCKRCGFCNARRYATDFCTVCGNCVEGCCACHVCTSCYGKSKKENCGSCGQCATCCKCWICKTCNTGKKVEVDREYYCFDCHQCAEHCKCVRCTPEGTPPHLTSRKYQCRSCAKCKDHCVCVECPGCHVKLPKRHIDSHERGGGTPPCGYCSRCCTCFTQGLPFRTGKFQMWNSIFAKGEFKGNPNRRHLSVEIEVDKFNTGKNSKKVNQSIVKWGDSVVKDGSIPGGAEINTNPCNGDLFIEHIKEVCDGLAEINSGCTTACGLHVHVNVKGTPLLDKDHKPVLNHDGQQLFDPRDAYTFYDLRRLIMLYYIVERAVYALCDPRRLTSRFSQICGKYYLTKHVNPADFRKDMVQKMYLGGARLTAPKPGKGTNRDLIATGKSLKGHKSAKYRDVRYKALNLHSFFLRGTVEFRHKEGTVDFHEITNWALICATIVDQASKMTEAQIRALPREDPYKALLSILPDNLRQWAERKYASQEQFTPRFKATIEDAWAGQFVDTF